MQRLQLTVNPSEEAIVQGALAHSKGEDIYEAIRLHQARLDGTEPETVKRKYYVLEKYVPCWKVLRHSDKRSGAAGAAAAGMGTRRSTDGSGDSDIDVDTDDPTNGPRKNGKVGGAARKFDPRTPGSKAAKRGRMEDLAAAREVRASTEALNAIATASAERSAIILFNQPGMRDTEEAKLFMRTKARQMLVAAGVPVGPPHALSWTPDRLPAAVPAYAATGVASVYGVCDDDDNDTERPPPPPPAAPLAVAPPRIPTNEPAAEKAALADASALEGPVAASPDRAAARVRARDGPSPRSVRGKDGPSAPLSRAVRAQLTKAMAAAAQARTSLGTTLPLADGDSCDNGLSSPSGPARTPRLSDQSSSESDVAESLEFVYVVCACVCVCGRRQQRFFFSAPVGQGEVFFFFFYLYVPPRTVCRGCISR